MAAHGPVQLDRSPVLDLRVLEAIADQRPLDAILTLIAGGLEALVVGWRVSVLLVSPDGTRLHHGAAPTLPETYVRAIDGAPVSASSGSCGTAAHRRAVVIVEDIATDPLWVDYREVALQHGLRACWSVPVLDRDGTVLATFAVYHATPARPEPAHLELIRRFVHLTHIAISHERAQREIRTSEERFRTVFRDAAFGLAVSDLSGRFIHTNPAYQRMLGYSEEELRELTVGALTHPDERASTVGLVRAVVEGRRESATMEQRYLRKDGRLVWARVTISPRHDAEGRVKDTIAVAEDITQARQAEQMRLQQQALLQMASRLGRLGAWWMDVPSRIVHLSEEAAAIQEAAEPVAPVDTLFAHMDADDRARLQSAFEACSTHGEPFDDEARLGTARGAARWMRVIGEAVRDEKGAVVRVQGALQDITDRKHLEQQSLRSQRLDSIGTLAGGIAHDLNNVLTPIAMGIGLLKAGEDDAGRRQVLDVIEQSATRAASLVQQVLSFARGAEGHRRRVAPARLVGDVAALLTETLPRRIALDIEIADGTWDVHADPTQIHQVLLNLCVNARDAMPDGGTLRISIGNVPAGPEARHLRVQPDRPTVRISVEDTGEGIAADVIDKIFDPFFTTKPAGRGTGLGLSTSLGIVHGHGGRIDVSSVPGAGSRFDVLLPAAPSTAVEPDATSHEPDVAPGHGTILLVDDEPAVRLVARHVLQRSGYDVLEAGSGEQALAVFGEHADAIIAVVTDMMMPGMDGATLVRALRERAAAVPIIGMSGIGVSDRLTPAEVAGLAGFLQKPYTPEALRAAVQRAVRGTPGGPAPSS